MELEWKEAIKIPDGTHNGEISKIVYRTEPYEYTDIYVKFKVNGSEVEIKYGCPTVLSDNSKLGRVLKAFGANTVAGTLIDPEKALVGQKVIFMTMEKKSKKDGNMYAEIVTDSIKPAV